MGLLIQTSILIMVIALITYSRLDLFLPRKGLEQEMTQFMSVKERDWMNRTSKIYYDMMHPEKKTNNTPTNPAEGPRAQSATGMISLRPLFEERSQIQENTKIVLRNLMTTLYQNQPFVINELKKGGYPDASTMFSELIEAIIQAGAAMPVEERPTNQSQLISLQLGAHQPLFTNIVNGCSCSTREGEADEEGEETVVPRNYCSLFSFANMKPYKNISIYLAPEQILESLYGNRQVVEEILNVRKQAHREFDKDRPVELEQFKAVPAAIDAQYLDFRVTGTDPNKNKDVR